MAEVRISRHDALASIDSSGGRRVLRQLLKSGPCSRRQIAQTTGLTEVAVSRSAQRLIAAGVLVEKKLVNVRTQRGRPSIDLHFSQQYFVAGIGIRGYTQWVEVRTFGGELIDLRKFSCQDLTDPDSVLRDCSNELKSLLAARRIPMQRILHLGILIVGVIDPHTGWVVRAENLGWGRVEIRKRVSRLTGLPVSVENMLNGMNLQQQLESSSDCESTLLVSVALGIGASVIIDDQVVRGHGAAAGQLGHQKSLSSQRICLCGRMGCLDTVASGRALLLANQMIDTNTSPIQDGFVARFRELRSEERRVG